MIDANKRKKLKLATRAVVLLFAVAGILASYQNCAPMTTAGVMPNEQDKLAAPHPFNEAQKIVYRQWEGSARVIELSLDHQTRKISAEAVDVSNGQPVACTTFDGAVSYAQLSGLLSSIELGTGDPNLVCTMNLKDNVDLTFVDSTTFHFGFSRCDSQSAKDGALKAFVRALCPN
jgi:hypothetical protein